MMHEQGLQDMYQGLALQLFVFPTLLDSKLQKIGKTICIWSVADGKITDCTFTQHRRKNASTVAVDGCGIVFSDLHEGTG